MTDTIEPSAIWSSRQMIFDRELSDRQNIMLSQGRFALSDMLKKIVQLYQHLNSMPNIIDSYSHHDIPQTLSEICFHQGIASSILFNNSQKNSKENMEAFNLRLQRFNYVKRFCDTQSISTSILSNRTVRNQLVHIDEHLVKALSKSNTGWFIDIAIAFRDQFSPPPGIQMGYCRTFIASEEVILHLDNEISVPKLWDEAAAVLAVVFGATTPDRPKPPPHSRQAA
jgi:hypothetical protein